MFRVYVLFFGGVFQTCFFHFWAFLRKVGEKKPMAHVFFTPFFGVFAVIWSKQNAEGLFVLFGNLRLHTKLMVRLKL